MDRFCIDFPWDVGLASVLVVGTPIILCVHIEEGREKKRAM